MFQMPALNASATASPVMRSGVARTSAASSSVTATGGAAPANGGGRSGWRVADGVEPAVAGTEVNPAVPHRRRALDAGARPQPERPDLARRFLGPANAERV